MRALRAHPGGREGFRHRQDAHRPRPVIVGAVVDGVARRVRPRRGAEVIVVSPDGDVFVLEDGVATLEDGDNVVRRQVVVGRGDGEANDDICREGEGRRRFASYRALECLLRGDLPAGEERAHAARAECRGRQCPGIARLRECVHRERRAGPERFACDGPALECAVVRQEQDRHCAPPPRRLFGAFPVVAARALQVGCVRPAGSPVLETTILPVTSTSLYGSTPRERMTVPLPT